MEDADWGQPLLKDCLFSEVLIPKTPDLPELGCGPLDEFQFDDLSSMQSSNDLFETAENGSSNTKFSLSVAKSERSSSQSLLPSPNTSSNAHRPLVMKSEPPFDDDDCSQSVGYRSLHSLTPSENGSVSSSPVKNGSSASPGMVTSPYEYSHVTGNRQTAAASGGGSPNRPRLLIATLPSSLAVIRRRTAAAAAAADRVDSSPSPPSSSDGSSPSDGLGPCFGPLRNRSKMHELALKNRLITEQDPKGAGSVALSSEEKRTLIQEGYPLPNRLPLTKHEEEALKIVRRKIKNKLSAQESRRKRKEYMETLEQRIQNCHTENSTLRQRVRQLEHSNLSLMGQLKKLQSLVGGSVPSVSISTQTSVCLTALILLFAVCIPYSPSVLPAHISPWYRGSSDISESIGGSMRIIDHDYSPATKPSRVLLSTDDQCEIPYSSGFFSHSTSSEEEEETNTVVENVRSDQQELFFASKTNSDPDDKGNISVVARVQKINSCDVESCKSPKAGDIPVTSDA